MKNNQQLIKQIEVKIKDITALIKNQEQNLTECKSTVQNLAQKLEEIKKQIDMNNNNKNSRKGSKYIK